MRYVLDAWIRKVASGYLPRTLQQVSDKCRESNARPVVEGPPEGREDRCDEQGGIGHPPRDDDIGSALERFEDGLGSEVGVRRHHRTGKKWLVQLDRAIGPG